MKTSEVDILIVPGWSSSGPDHWQSRWERNLKTAKRVNQEDWYHPNCRDWVSKIVESVVNCVRPVMLVGHSLGSIAVVHAGSKLGRLPAPPIGAFLVAPADVEHASDWPITQGFNYVDQLQNGFSPLPVQPLPFPSLVVASSNDPYCSLKRAHELANAWGSALINCGDLGHINVDSGHGPWPDGLLSFGIFLQRL
ncbi:MAG: RBBP9/YdeN family alpha/beta hydrolase [Hyphomicrobium sp.]